MSRKRKSPDPAAASSPTGTIAPSYPPQQVEKAPPCQINCPNCGDIRGWIGIVAQRDQLGLSRSEAYERAWRTIIDVNPFPATLGRICPHPCEQHCNRQAKDEPLAINALERFLGDFAIERRLGLESEPLAAANHWVGVIGAGPSGLSFAYQMARRGYRVTVYDAREKPGGMLRYGVPDYRLPQDVLDAEIRRIVDLGVELRLNTRVGTDVSLEQLRARHDSLYLGIGAQQGRGLSIPGADGPGVLAGTDYLGAVNRGEPTGAGKAVIVVGGGNTAIDSARCARREGADVTLLYRRSRREMPAVDAEIEDALAEGVELIELAVPVAVIRDGADRPRAIVVQRMRLGDADASGRRSPEPLEGSEFTLEADTLITAISQVPVLDGLEMLDHEGSWLVVDAAGAVGDTILAGGDALGLGIAGNAIVQGRRAAESLHERLTGAPETDVASSRAEVRSEQVRFESKPVSEPVHKPELPARDRVRQGMAEVSGNISENEFLAETERCFSCGSCFGCEQCFMYCTKGCFTRLEEPRPGMYFALNLDECQACGKCVEVCPCGFLEVRSPVPEGAA
jgi:NADPH-dependent glutamate synthase beta subunit-like oxidoreductase/ferredoxin